MNTHMYTRHVYKIQIHFLPFIFPSTLEALSNEYSHFHYVFAVHSSDPKFYLLFNLLP